MWYNPLCYVAAEHLAFSLTVGVFLPPQSPKDTQTSTCSVKALSYLVCVCVTSDRCCPTCLLWGV